MQARLRADYTYCALFRIWHHTPWTHKLTAFFWEAIGFCYASKTWRNNWFQLSLLVYLALLCIQTQCMHSVCTRTMHGASNRGHAVLRSHVILAWYFVSVVVVMRWAPPGVRDKRLAGEDAVVVRGWSVRARENRCWGTARERRSAISSNTWSKVAWGAGNLPPKLWMRHLTIDDPCLELKTFWSCRPCRTN